MKKETACIHPLIDQRSKEFGVTVPINTAVAYEYAGNEELKYPGFLSTPNQKRLGMIVARLEGAQYGIAFSSGMSAITCSILAMIKAGDHVIFAKEIYGGTMKFAEEELIQRGAACSFAKTNLKNLELCQQKNTRAVFIESPSNPLLNISDLKAISAWAKAQGIVTIIDNTFATPVNQQPLDMGIDIVVHSGTKYLGGHNDLMFGAIATNNEAYYQDILAMAKIYGGALDAASCYMAERSIKTLGLRVKQQNDSANRIAHFLEEHPKVKQVYYPGLISHPKHATAARQMLGFGGIVSFEIEQSAGTSDHFLPRLKVIQHALSLGGVESLISVPVLTSHAGLKPAQRQELGINDSLLRLSVGIENTEDLIEDLNTALEELSS
ncbi:MAG: PLP-dependent aspartate aminotransferase family protein [Cyclobacteriaceae bacterium]